MLPGKRLGAYYGTTTILPMEDIITVTRQLQRFYNPNSYGPQLSKIPMSMWCIVINVKELEVFLRETRCPCRISLKLKYLIVEALTL